MARQGEVWPGEARRGKSWVVREATFGWLFYLLTKIQGRVTGWAIISEKAGNRLEMAQLERLWEVCGSSSML